MSYDNTGTVNYHAARDGSYFVLTLEGERRYVSLDMWTHSMDRYELAELWLLALDEETVQRIVGYLPRER